MTVDSKKRNPEEQFLRRTFDAVENFEVEEVERQFRRFDRRSQWIVISIVAGLVLLWAAVGLMRAGADYLAWANRPSIQERIVAPFGLEERAIPAVDTQVNKVLPAEVGSFTFLEESEITTLLANCLMGTCKSTYPPLYLEWVSYQRDGESPLSVVIAEFEFEEDADAMFRGMYNYSRAVGRMGNYALVGSLKVNYFYSSTRNVFSFTWTNGPWVYTVSGDQIDALNEFLVAFPY